MSPDSRVTELELRFMAQQELIEELNRQILALDRTVERLQARVDRMEGQTEALVRQVFPPPNEKPPHY